MTPAPIPTTDPRVPPGVEGETFRLLTTDPRLLAAVAALLHERNVLRLAVARVLADCSPIADADGNRCGAEIPESTLDLLRELTRGT